MIRQYVVATPNRNPHALHARALEEKGKLRLHLFGGRSVREGVDAARTRYNIVVGGLSAAAMRWLPAGHDERARYALNPWFDRWAKRHLRSGDRLITSFGYGNASMEWVKHNGGLAILDAGNSHPENFWEIISEEHSRWSMDLPPVSRGHFRRAVAAAESADFVIGLSTFVTKSFIARGFAPERTFVMPRPVDLDVFRPSERDRPAGRPFTIVCTGGINLRKGTPYLFEALRLIRKQVSDVQLWLNEIVHPSMQPLLARYSDLPIKWFPVLGRAKLAAHLRQADLFILPSLEDGLARTATEAMASGLPVVLTANTGAADLVEPDVSGDVVPVRDPEAIAESALRWWERIRGGHRVDTSGLRERLSYERFLLEWDKLAPAMDRIAPAG